MAKNRKTNQSTKPTGRKIRLERKFKKSADFEYNPPRCHDCIHFKRSLVRDSDATDSKHVAVFIFICTLGRIRVQTYSICNNWENNKGEKLQ